MSNPLKNSFKFCLILTFVAMTFRCFSQPQKTISLKIILWDYTTGLDLPTRVSTYSKGIKTAEFQNTNDIVISKNIDTLTLESEGYNPIKFPVNFFGLFEKDTYTSISIKTEKLDTSHIAGNYLVYCNPKIKEDNYIYEKRHYQKSIFHCMDNISTFIKAQYGFSFELGEKFKDAEYEFLVKKNNEILNESRFSPQKGLNFIDFNIYPKVNNDFYQKDQIIIDKQIVNIELKTYFFEQSKYDLLPDNKLKLDSLVMLLRKIPKYTLKVKGFTDNIGDAQKNLTLAEYRAKVVANYLVFKGIDEKLMEVDWEKSDEASLKNIADGDLRKYRKVEINIKL